ncbi:MAG: TIGR04388 family protein [bacterium]|nr:TIGR04388 family protein [bacterium]
MLSEKKDCRRIRFLRSTLLLSGILLTGVFSSDVARAQPITIPALTTPTFNPTDFDPYFAAARQERSIPAWQTLIEQAGIVLGSQWETQVDAQIAAELAGVTQSDAFNSPAEYQEYLRRELLIQKQDAFAGWELQAMAAIETERAAFLTGLSSLDPSQAAADSDRAIDAGRSSATAGQQSATDAQSFDELVNSVNQQANSWQEQFSEDYEAGLYQYSQALAGIEQNYNDFVQDLAQKDQEFQSNIAQIEAFENNVRTGIGTQLDALEGSLLTNGVFHTETCDGENVCSLDPNTLNASGTQLQALITSMRAGLQNGTPLSTLSNQMITYLQTSRTQAEADRQNWDTLSSATENLPVFGVSLGGLQDPAVFSIPEVAAIDEYFLGAHSRIATITRQRSAQPSYRTITINSANALAYTPPGLIPIQVPVFSTVTRQGEWYSVANRGALSFDHTVVPVITDPIVTRIAESEIQIHVTYTWQDTNAQANRDRWAGYVSDMDAVLAQWQNTILPAANTWETQKNTYAANYTAWQTQAQAQQATALATTEQNRELVIADRNRFISTSEAAYRDGQNAWRDIAKDVVAARESAGDLSVASTNIIDRIQQIGGAPGLGNNLTEIMRNLGTLPEPSQEFLNRTRAPLPELQNLSTVARGLQTSLIGAANYSLTSATQESFERERDKARDSLVKLLQTSRLAKTSDGSIALSLLMQRVDPAHRTRLQALGQEELVRHINGTLGLAADSDLTVNSVQIFAQLTGTEFEKPIGELIAARRADADAAIWTVQEIDGGKLRATRQIKDGNAFQRFGGDGTRADGYIAGQQEQVMEFAAPAVMRLADTDGLFEAWETSTILDNADDQLKQFAGHAKEQSSAVWNAGARADAYRSAKDAQYNLNVQNQTFIASIIKAALTSAFTGGNAIEGASGVVRSRVMGPIYSALETATGIPAGIWGSLAGGADLEQAVISHGFSMLEEATGMQGLAHMLQQEWGKMQARQARREAQRFRPEDLIPSGPITMVYSQMAYSSNPLIANHGRAMAGLSSPTYAWRNAQHHDDGAKALLVAETVGAAVIQGAGVIIPGLGNATASAIIAGYQAAKQGYLGSLNGGTRGAVAGIASGAVGGLVRHYSGGLANVGFSYSYEDGFGVSAGGRVPFLELTDGVGLSLGASASWNEREGVTHAGASLGITAGIGGPEGPSLFAGLNYDSDRGVYGSAGIQDFGPFESSSAALTYSPEEGYGAEFNFTTDHEGLPDVLNGTGGVSYTENSGLSAGFYTDENSLDRLELSYNESDGLTGNFTAPGGVVSYGPDGLSVQPNTAYWLDYASAVAGLPELEIPEVTVAGFDLGYDPEKGFTAVLPGDEEDVFAWNQTDGASSPYLESLEQQAQDTVETIENAGGIVDQVEAIVGVVQNPGDFMDLDPFGGENPFEDLPDLSGIFGGDEDETDGSVEVAGGPDGEGEAGGESGAGEGGTDGEGEEQIAGGGAPDGGEGIAGHRGGGYTNSDGYHISSEHSKDQIEALNQRFGISESTVTTAAATLAGCNAMAIPTEGGAREQALLAQIKCYAGIPAPPEGILTTEAPSLEQLGAQTYSEDFIAFVEASENKARTDACKQSGKRPEHCAVVKIKHWTVNSYQDSATRQELQMQAEQLNRIAGERGEQIYNVSNGVATVSTFEEDRGTEVYRAGRPTLSTSDDFTNDWLKNSETGKLYADLSEAAAEADLRRRQAERELFQLSMKDEAETAMNATGFGNLSKTKKSDREKGLVESFAEEAYQLAVQMKNTVANFVKDVAKSAIKDFDAFVASLDSFIADPFNAEKFFGFMKATSDFGGNPAMIPVVSLPPAGQIFGRGFSIADLVTAMHEGEVVGSVAALWGVLSGTKTGNLIEDYGANQITKSELVQDVTAAASEKLNKIRLAPCKTCETCVVAGTPILTPSGDRPIESLRVGDTVIAYDTDAGKTVERKITQLHRDITIEWYDVRVGADTLTVTDNHPFWLPEIGEWVPARELKVGTVLQSKDGTAARISQISIRKLRQSEPIYNVEVEGEHNYFAGKGALLVHNGGGTNGKNCIACFSAIWEKRFEEIWENISDYKYGKNLSSTPGSRYGNNTAEKDVFEMFNDSDELQDFVLGIYKGKSLGVNKALLKNNLENLNLLHRRNMNGSFGVDIVEASAGTVSGTPALIMRRVEGLNTKGNLDILKRDFAALRKNPFAKREREHLKKQLESVRNFLEPDPTDVSKSVYVKDFQMMIDVKSGGLTIIDPGEVIPGQRSGDALADIDELLAAITGP